MKKLLSFLILTMSFVFILKTNAQDFSITNKYVLTNVIEVVTTFKMDLTPVVSSAGLSMTNNSRWGTWIPKYIDACIYTNGLTTNNVIDVKVLWGEPDRQIRNYYQGTPPQWNGKFYTTLPIAKERILAGQKLHCLLSIQDNSTLLSNLVTSTNVIWANNGVAYKVIDIPTSKPSWIP